MIKYRPDIDGLRAVAVLAVVMFHAFPRNAPGGFIGVDIFFVISGYLISTIILEAIQAGRFSLMDFYGRRVRRIFPALLLVMVTCYVAGWFVLFPNEYQALGKHIAGGAGFVANLVLWQESGYFDAAADTKPLLHLWSLGIEEQFYLVWPLLLMLCWRVLPRAVGWLLLVGLIASFAANIVLIKDDATATFYAPYTRFWELFAGAGLAYITLHLPAFLAYLRRYSNLLAWVGSACIAVTLSLLTKDDAFPGWWAALPVMGAVLLIAAGPAAWVNRNVLSHRLVVWVGLISYPLYLWHWPLLVFPRIYEGHIPLGEVRLGLMLLAVALAWGTYHLVERPLRFGTHLRVKALGLASAMLLLGVVGYERYQGLPNLGAQAYVEHYLQSMQRPSRGSECFDIAHAYDTDGKWHCSIGNAKKSPMLFVYGDSHALSLMPALEMLAKARNSNILFAGGSGCPPFIGVQAMRGTAWNEKYNCRKLNTRVFEYVKTHKIPAVLMAARWSYYTTGALRPAEFNPIAVDESANITVATSQAAFAEGLRKTVDAYRAIGVKVYLLHDIPQQHYEPTDVLRRSLGHHVAKGDGDADMNRLSVSREQHHEHQAIAEGLITKMKKHVTPISFESKLCNETTCPLIRDGKFLYYDDDHLSVTGSEYIYPLLEKAIR